MDMPILNEDFVGDNEAEAMTEQADENDENNHNGDNIPEVRHLGDRHQQFGVIRMNTSKQMTLKTLDMFVPVLNSLMQKRLMKK